MTHRILPRDEWYRLDGTDLEKLAPHLPPEAHVLVVEDGDTIAACCSFFPMWHLEGTNVMPDYQRNPAVMRHLLAGMRSVAKEVGAERVLTAAVDDAMRGYLLRLDAEPLPEATHFVWPIGQES